jgi:hypothetical protein
MGDRVADPPKVPSISPRATPCDEETVSVPAAVVYESV